MANEKTEPKGSAMAESSALIAQTHKALEAFGAQGPIQRARALTMAVELQAMLDGQVEWVSKSADEQKRGIVVRASPAQCCAAALFCVKNGLSVIAGHVLMLGGKMYTSERGYLAAAQNVVGKDSEPVFAGFEPPEPMTPEERAMLGVVDRERYVCAVKVRAHRTDLRFPAVGFGWWDMARDQETGKSAPGKMAQTRARRHALMQLFGLGATPEESEEVVVDVEAEAPQPRPTLAAQTPTGGGLIDLKAVKEAAEQSHARALADHHADTPKADPPAPAAPPTPQVAASAATGGGFVAGVLQELDAEAGRAVVKTVDAQMTAPVKGEAIPGLGEKTALQKRAVCSAFLRLVWNRDRKVVEAAAESEGVDASKASRLPVEDLVGLVEAVAERLDPALRKAVVEEALGAVK